MRCEASCPPAVGTSLEDLGESILKKRAVEDRERKRVLDAASIVSPYFPAPLLGP